MEDEEETETLLDIQHTPVFKLKRKGLILTLFFFYFLCGLEYSITIPSSLLDGKYSDDDRTFMLVEVGLYPLAAIITSFSLGHVYDRTKKIRLLLITLALLQVIGNLIYAINYTKWLPLFGRFVSGLGDGFDALSIAEISYLYEEHDRIGMICFLELGRVLGFLNGPLVDFFIVKWSRRHTWSYNKKTIPAYVMGCSWAAVTLIAFCSAHNLAFEVIEKFNLNDSPFLRKKTRLYNAETHVYENIEDADHVDVFNPTEELSDTNDSDADDGEAEKDAGFEHKADEIFPIPDRPPPKLTLKQRIAAKFSSKYQDVKEKVSDDAKDIINKSHVHHVLYLEIAFLMTMNFFFWYSQTTFLMFASYITTFEYKWGPLEIGSTYVVGFFVVVSMLLIMYFVRVCLSKTNVYYVVIALAFTQISLALLIYESVPRENNKRMIVFIISGILVFASIPFTFVCFKTLVTTMVRPGLQGTLQGIAASIVRLAVIAGLLLSIVTVHGRQVYAAVMTVVCFLIIIFFFLAYERITRRQKESRMKLTY